MYEYYYWILWAFGAKACQITDFGTSEWPDLGRQVGRRSWQFGHFQIGPGSQVGPKQPPMYLSRLPAKFCQLPSNIAHTSALWWDKTLAEGMSAPFMKIVGPVSNLVHGRAYGKWEVPRSFDPPSTCALQFWGDALHFSMAQILKLHDQGRLFGIPTCIIYTRSRQVDNP